jgi:hypothetical protein
MFGLKKKMSDQSENQDVNLNLGVEEEGRGDDTETQTVPKKSSKKNDDGKASSLEGKTVRFTEPVATAFGATTGKFVKNLPGDAEAIIQVGDDEKVVGVESFEFE